MTISGGVLFFAVCNAVERHAQVYISLWFESFCG
jgi:hypothetical protein